MEVFDRITGMGTLGTEAILLGSLLLLVGLLHKSETFERLVGSRVRGPLNLAYGAYGLPLMLLMMEIQRRSPRRSGGGGIFRFLGFFVILIIIVVIVVLALIAFVIYRLLRRRRR